MTGPWGRYVRKQRIAQLRVGLGGKIEECRVKALEPLAMVQIFETQTKTQLGHGAIHQHKGATIRSVSGRINLPVCKVGLPGCHGTFRSGAAPGSLYLGMHPDPRSGSGQIVCTVFPFASQAFASSITVVQ